jgi:ribosome-associated translation inhibitor RaiA
MTAALLLRVARRETRPNIDKPVTNPMKLNVQFLNIPSIHEHSAWVNEQILALGDARRIDGANARIVRLAEASPAYQVNVHLATPGPDLFVESRDHTLRAAVSKAISELREQIATRAAKPLRRLKSNLNAPRPSAVN